MKRRPGKQIQHVDEIESQEWLESLNYVIKRRGPDRVNSLLEQLRAHALQAGVQLPFP